MDAPADIVQILGEIITVYGDRKGLLRDLRVPILNGDRKATRLRISVAIVYNVLSADVFLSSIRAIVAGLDLSFGQVVVAGAC